MGHLTRSTRRADTAIEECTCYRDCSTDPSVSCELSGDWHTHADEPCARHTQGTPSR